MCRFGVLGSIEVRAEGRLLALGGTRQVALLAYFLLHRGRRVGVEELVDAVWEEHEPDGSVKRVQVAVARLRRSLSALGDAVTLTTVGSGYRLEAHADDIDAEVFAGRIHGGRDALRDGRYTDALQLLEEALALWRDRPLAEVSSMRFAQREIARLEELRLDAIEARIEAERALGRSAGAVDELEALVTSHPAREGLTAQLMLALYESGRQADALEAYRRTRAHLTGELGLEPGPGLRDLQARILAQDPALDRPQAAAPDPVVLLPPAPELVGREQDVTALGELLVGARTRLVTIIGPGGVGKTSAAAAVAHAVVGRFPDGVVFADLAPVRDPGDVASALLSALRAPGVGGGAPSERLRAAFAGKTQLLVIDNFEHVLEAAPVVASLVDDVVGLRILVTSRAPLGLRSEQRYPLAPLEQDEASALFVARARARDPTFALDAARERAVADICARVSGLPLGIELVAARTGVLSPASIATRLAAQTLDLRLDLRDAPARHQSLRAALDWSVELLSAAERDAFERFAVFVGGCTPEAAEAVAGLGLDLLEGLLNQSLLVRRADSQGEPRVAMLEPVREYAAEHLEARSDETAIRGRHARYFLARAQDARSGLDTPDWAAWRDRVLADIENIRAALHHAVRVGDADLALGLASSVATVLSEQWRPLEADELLTAALDAAGDAAAPRLRADALIARAQSRAGDEARDDAAAALEIYEGLGDATGVARCLVELGFLEVSDGRLDAATDFGNRAARRLRAAGLGEDMPSLLGLRVLSAGTFVAAKAHAEEAMRRFRATGVTRHIGGTEANLAVFALEEDQFEDALALAEAAAARWVEARADTGLADSRGTEACAALYLGDLDRAARAFADELRICRRIGYFELLGGAVLEVAALAAARGDVARSGFLAGAAAAALRRRRELIYMNSDDVQRRLRRRYLEPARQVAPADWDRAAAEGERLTDHAALDAALAYCTAATS